MFNHYFPCNLKSAHNMTNCELCLTFHTITQTKKSQDSQSILQVHITDCKHYYPFLLSHYSMHSWLSTLSDHILSYFEPGYENASKNFRTLNRTFSIKYNNELVVNSNMRDIECKCKPKVNENLVSCFKVEKYWCELIHQERVVYE